MNNEQKLSILNFSESHRKELERLKSSQIRVERITKIYMFYEEMYKEADFIDEFESYKEDYKKKHNEYKEDFDKYVLPLMGDVHYEFEAAISRSQEKRIVLKECMRLIMLCLSSTISPKRKDTQLRKITKGRLIDAMKEIERYTLAITEYPSGFQSQYFDEIQRLRIAFLYDGINQILEFVGIDRAFTPVLFDQSVASKLEQTITDTRRNSISKYFKINKNHFLKRENFKKSFMDRFLLQIEDAMKRSPRV